MIFNSSNNNVDLIQENNVVVMKHSSDWVGTNPGSITGCVAYWDFNTSGTSTTDIINNNVGSIVGALFDNGRYENGLSFNGNSDYVSLGNVGINSQQDHSFSAWIWLNDTWASQGQIIGGRRGDVTSLGVTSTRTLECREDDEVLTGLVVIPTKQWIHVIYTFKYNGLGATNCTQICYINGSLDKTRISSNYQDVWSVSNTWIGWESRFNFYFNGKIDEVGIYNKVLTNLEIQQIYNNGYPKFKTLQTAGNITINNLNNNNLIIKEVN